MWGDYLIIQQKACSEPVLQWSTQSCEFFYLSGRAFIKAHSFSSSMIFLSLTCQLISIGNYLSHVIIIIRAETKASNTVSNSNSTWYPIREAQSATEMHLTFLFRFKWQLLTSIVQIRQALARISFPFWNCSLEVPQQAWQAARAQEPWQAARAKLQHMHNIF